MNAINVVPFLAAHWGRVDEQPGLLAFEPSPDQLKVYESAPWAITIFAGYRAIFCGGVVPLWPNRGEAWARLAKNCVQEFAGLHRVVRRVLFETCTLRRIEAVVECDFPQGHRWMELLGFKQEAQRMVAYYPDGRDCALYALVREEDPRNG